MPRNAASDKEGFGSAMAKLHNDMKRYEMATNGPKARSDQNSDFFSADGRSMYDYQVASKFHDMGAPNHLQNHGVVSGLGSGKITDSMIARQGESEREAFEASLNLANPSTFDTFSQNERGNVKRTTYLVKSRLDIARTIVGKLINVRDVDYQTLETITIKVSENTWKPAADLLMRKANTFLKVETKTQTMFAFTTGFDYNAGALSNAAPNSERQKLFVDFVIDQKVRELRQLYLWLVMQRFIEEGRRYYLATKRHAFQMAPILERAHLVVRYREGVYPSIGGVLHKLVGHEQENCTPGDGLNWFVMPRIYAGEERGGGPYSSAQVLGDGGKTFKTPVLSQSFWSSDEAAKYAIALPPIPQPNTTPGFVDDCTSRPSGSEVQPLKGRLALMYGHQFVEQRNVSPDAPTPANAGAFQMMDEVDHQEKTVTAGQAFCASSCVAPGALAWSASTLEACNRLTRYHNGGLTDADVKVQYLQNEDPYMLPVFEYAQEEFKKHTDRAFAVGWPVVARKGTKMKQIGKAGDILHDGAKYKDTPSNVYYEPVDRIHHINPMYQSAEAIRSLVLQVRNQIFASRHSNGLTAQTHLSALKMSRTLVLQQLAFGMGSNGTKPNPQPFNVDGSDVAKCYDIDQSSGYMEIFKPGAKPALGFGGDTLYSRPHAWVAGHFLPSQLQGITNGASSSVSDPCNRWAADATELHNDIHRFRGLVDKRACPLFSDKSIPAHMKSLPAAFQEKNALAMGFANHTTSPMGGTSVIFCAMDQDYGAHVPSIDLDRPKDTTSSNSNSNDFVSLEKWCAALVGEIKQMGDNILAGSTKYIEAYERLELITESSFKRPERQVELLWCLGEALNNNNGAPNGAFRFLIPISAIAAIVSMGKEDDDDDDVDISGFLAAIKNVPEAKYDQDVAFRLPLAACRHNMGESFLGSHDCVTFATDVAFCDDKYRTNHTHFTSTFKESCVGAPPMSFAFNNSYDNVDCTLGDRVDRMDRPTKGRPELSVGSINAAKVINDFDFIDKVSAILALSCSAPYGPVCLAAAGMNPAFLQYLEASRTEVSVTHDALAVRKSPDNYLGVYTLQSSDRVDPTTLKAEYMLFVFCGVFIKRPECIAWHRHVQHVYDMRPMASLGERGPQPTLEHPPHAFVYPIGCSYSTDHINWSVFARNHALVGNYANMSDADLQRALGYEVRFSGHRENKLVGKLTENLIVGIHGRWFGATTHMLRPQEAYVADPVETASDGNVDVCIFQSEGYNLRWDPHSKGGLSYEYVQRTGPYKVSYY